MAVLLVYGSHFLSGAYYCLSVFWCAVARMLEPIVKLGKSGSEIREMLVQVYGDNAMKKTAVYKWLKPSAEGRESVTDEESSGQPATSRTEENIAKVRKLACKLSADCQEHSRASEDWQRNS
jgi:hypothetical protein